MNDAGRAAEGAWIFVSHSHKDLEKVRRIRNAFEGKGHNPLLFFLKCLDDDSELDELIRREIEARTWFVLCDSPNARASRWVQDEVVFIKSLEGKVYEVIDLDDDLGTQVERIAALSRRATVFISYSREDQAVADAIRAALRRQDFAVFDTFDKEYYRKRPPGTPYLSAVERAMDEALERGFVLFLLSPESLRSKTVQWEVIHALDPTKHRPCHFNVVPVLVGEQEATLVALAEWISEACRLYPGPSLAVHRALTSIAWFDLTPGSPEERIAELIGSLKTRKMD